MSGHSCVHSLHTIYGHVAVIVNYLPSDVCALVLFEQILTLCTYCSSDSCSLLCFSDMLTGHPPHLLFQIHFLMILSANWAYLKDASHMHAYQDIKMKEERELQDITSRSKECLNSYT